MQEKDQVPDNSVMAQSQILQSPKVTVVKTADKPSEAILIGIEKFIATSLPVV